MQNHDRNHTSRWHVLGLQKNWDAQAAGLAAGLFQRKKDRFGNFIAPSVEALCELVKGQLTRQSVDVILQTCMSENGITVGPGASALIERALDGANGLVDISVKLDRPQTSLTPRALQRAPVSSGPQTTPGQAKVVVKTITPLPKVTIETL